MTPAKRSEIRHRLFDLYATNVQFHTTGFPTGVFLCPICLRAFPRTSVAAASLSVDLAHVSPQSVGGRRYTLTCKSCNSTAGAKIDSQLKIEMEQHSALTSTAESTAILAKCTVMDETVRAFFYGDGQNMSVAFSARHSDPAAISRLSQKMANATGEAHIGISFQSINPVALELSLVQSAFLSIFRSFGYEYLRYESGEFVRTALANTLVEGKLPTEPLFPIIPLPITPLTAEVPEGAIAKIRFRDDLQFLCVVLSTPSKQHAGRCVLLPALLEGGESLNALKGVVGKRHQVTFRWFDDPDPNARLRLPDLRQGLLELWQDDDLCGRPN